MPRRKRNARRYASVEEGLQIALDVALENEDNAMADVLDALLNAGGFRRGAILRSVAYTAVGLFGLAQEELSQAATAEDLLYNAQLEEEAKWLIGLPEYPGPAHETMDFPILGGVEVTRERYYTWSHPRVVEAAERIIEEVGLDYDANVLKKVGQHLTQLTHRGGTWERDLEPPIAYERRKLLVRRVRAEEDDE